ncbi:TPA: hypothetical protein U2R10_003976 [Proteus mirabilis]|uniref:hypothetical protein n=1 Tax=Morganella morganii TaxID=582 RepID=UPI0003F638C4|nr:hypothetical protein [Morganella morganii]MCT1586109.1 hypothetical protein [Morganella morganii]HBN5914262.1 hypothetical protein [Morganella morganii]HEM8846896.1 hypothetical protein [Proteus mirabilis]
MKEQYEIKITVTYDGDDVNLSAESKHVTPAQPSIFFMALTKFLNQQIRAGLKDKLALADDIADLIVGISEHVGTGD